MEEEGVLRTLLTSCNHSRLETVYSINNRLQGSVKPDEIRSTHANVVHNHHDMTEPRLCGFSLWRNHNLALTIMRISSSGMPKLFAYVAVDPFHI